VENLKKLVENLWKACGKRSLLCGKKPRPYKACGKLAYLSTGFPQEDNRSVC